MVYECVLVEQGFDILRSGLAARSSTLHSKQKAKKPCVGLCWIRVQLAAACRVCYTNLAEDSASARTSDTDRTLDQPLSVSMCLQTKRPSAIPDDSYSPTHRHHFPLEVQQHQQGLSPHTWPAQQPHKHGLRSWTLDSRSLHRSKQKFH